MLKELNEKGIGKYINLEKWGLSTFELKILAILAMFIDHFSIIFLENIVFNGPCHWKNLFPNNMFCFG